MFDSLALPNHHKPKIWVACVKSGSERKQKTKTKIVYMVGLASIKFWNYEILGFLPMSSPDMWVARCKWCLAFVESSGQRSVRGEGRGKRRKRGRDEMGKAPVK